VIPCASCGRGVFVYPASPWTSAPAPPVAASSHLLPLIAVIVVAAGAGTVGLFFLVRPFLARDSGAPSTHAEPAIPDLAAVMEEGRQALAARNPRRARRILTQVAETVRSRPGSASPAQQHELEQLSRQVDLLANLSQLSLQEILQHATQVSDDDEWREEFADHRGRAVFFNDVVKRDSRGRPALATYVVRSGKATARLALEDLTLWEQVPLDDAPEVMFGAKLASCEREDGGGWVFHFLPASGVLVTEPAAVLGWLPEARLKDVLNRQAQWLGLEER
jgi:hypothetical protein